MTMMDSHSITCPHCGNVQESVMWTTINVSNEPSLKKMLMEGMINTFVCKKCHEKRFIAIPLLYHDMDQKFCVQYYPTQVLDDEFLRQFNADGSYAFKDMSPAIAGSYIAHPHIVFDMAEMVRYIMFRDKLREQKGIETRKQI